jgi:hypothetical protein
VWKHHKEISCAAIFISNNKNTMFFFLSFIFYKIQEQVLWWEGEIDTSGSEEMAGKGDKMNMVQILRTHVCKGKNDTC